MKKIVYFDSYKTVFQNDSGGVQMRIKKMVEHNHSSDPFEIKLFNQWNDKLSNCDVLHIFKVNIDSYNLALMAKKLGKRVVVSSVVPIDNGFKIRAALMLNKCFKVLNTYAIYRNILNLSDAIVAQTSLEKAFIVKNYRIAKKKVHVIPNGVDERLINHNGFRSENRDLVLCVGRFDSNKNQLSLIKALKDTNIPLCFVGGPDNNEKEYYEKCLEESKGAENIKFLGWISHDDDRLIELYKQTKVAVLLSKKEIFGNSIIEGAASGANILYTNSLSMDEWGFDNIHAVSVDPKDIASIRREVLKLYSLNTSDSLIKKAKEVFDWDVIMHKYYDLYLGGEDANA